MAEKWANAAAYTLEVAELMPAADYTYQPTEDQMNFGNQLRHMAGNVRCDQHRPTGLHPCGLRRRRPRSQHPGRQPGQSGHPATPHHRLRPGRPRRRRPRSGDEETVVDFFAGPKTKRQLMALMQDHLTHHRGQVIVYLRLKE